MKIRYLLLVALLIPLSLVAKEASLKEILENPHEFEGKTVEIKGEVIGEPLKGHDGTWVNILSDEKVNLGVFVTDSDLLKPIKFWGQYTQIGDYIKVTGIFHENCPEHDERDIHLESLTILESGYTKTEEVDPFKVDLTRILLIICLTLVVIYLIKEKYGKRS